MTTGDVDAVVDIHLRAFPGFFLTFLGPRFLRVLYKASIEEEEIALVAEVEGHVAGFVLGSAAPEGYFSKLLRGHALAFAVAAAPSVVRRPQSTARLVRALGKPATAAKPAGTATLLSLGVDPSAQGRGLGKRLVGEFLDASRRLGAVRVDLTTDTLENDAVNAFYAGLGFRIDHVITTAEGRVMNEFVIDLASTTDERATGAP